ncbi:hypothetical protein NSIN_30341 [Nitrosotalea sinensis]|uniref:Uncharacterized protein n=1 Tax=Nitrosotalea sinensis TaxID=1499975 RepID=A0A2H1EIG8_9ARCH|nr:hypothetical protein [Candidatus Nitrosotalea sinensis]SHO47078.1 hypothetical protein NSIN_30341 [Candidatus Nitrosotalea sinensis]
MVSTKRATKGSQKANHDSPVIMDFGTRKISNQNFSKMIALPKTALANCSPNEIAQVNVKLVQDKGEKYIKLTPVCQTEKEIEK